MEELQNVYLEYKLEDGVVEKIYNEEPQTKDGYGTAITNGFVVGDEVTNFIIVGEVDENKYLISCVYIKEPKSAQYLREENIAFRNRIIELEDILAGVIGGAV